VPEKVVVVHNGVDLQEYSAQAVPAGRTRESLGLAPDDLLVGFTGNLIPRKGVDVLLRGFARCAARHPRMHLVIAGAVPVGSPVDYRARYEALCHELGVRQRVHFLGFVPDVRSLVVDVDMLVLPSLQEPFGRSIIEAMALGTPVIATRVGGIPEIIEDGRDGLLVPPSDEAALGLALERLAFDEPLRLQLARQAERKVCERFDVALRTREMEEILLNAAGRRASIPGPACT
jgi:glycosyltransferase involved in cell wall biosynthesis